MFEGILLLSVILCSASFAVQLQNGSFPLQFPAVTLPGVNGTCTSAMIREQTRQNVQEQVKLLLRNRVVPSLLRGQSHNYPALSCTSLSPSSPSGYYWVSNSIGSVVHVYCDMTRSCGGVTGGWMRVAELDMTNSSHQCPSGPRQRNDSNLHTCGNSFPEGCSSVIFSTSSVNYTSVCGRVIAYQYGTPDAFNIDHSIDSTMWMVLVLLMGNQGSTFGHLLQPLMKLFLVVYLPVVPVLEIIW